MKILIAHFVSFIYPPQYKPTAKCLFTYSHTHTRAHIMAIRYYIYSSFHIFATFSHQCVLFSLSITFAKRPVAGVRSFVTYVHNIYIWCVCVFLFILIPSPPTSRDTLTSRKYILFISYKFFSALHLAVCVSGQIYFFFVSWVCVCVCGVCRWLDIAYHRFIFISFSVRVYLPSTVAEECFY